MSFSSSEELDMNTMWGYGVNLTSKKKVVEGSLRLGLEEQWLQVGGNFFLFVSFHS
jgi:hypothetical protein